MSSTGEGAWAWARSFGIPWNQMFEGEFSWVWCSRAAETSHVPIQEESEGLCCRFVSRSCSHFAHLAPRSVGQAQKYWAKVRAEQPAASTRQQAPVAFCRWTLKPLLGVNLNAVFDNVYVRSKAKLLSWHPSHVNPPRGAPRHIGTVTMAWSMPHTSES